jgi:hypothetical protein
MKKNKFILIAIVLLVSTTLFGQFSNNEVKKISLTPKNLTDFDIAYKIILPIQEPIKWDSCYSVFTKFLTNKISKFSSISYGHDGILTYLCTPTVLCHAQLDTTTLIKNKDTLIGTWRGITHRKICFVDSTSIVENKIYRKDTLLLDLKNDDVFANFSDKKFTLIVKNEGEENYKKIISASYQIVSGRYLLLSKYFNTTSGISQIGIDENGNLISNYVSFVVNKSENKYLSFYTTIEQIIFERIK